MSDSAETMYRIACPACNKVLKAPLAWTGRRGTCPKCHKEIHFPRSTSFFTNAGEGAQTLLKLVGDSAAPLSDGDADRLALLLSQGTCMDYGLAQKLLAGRMLPARQWRRLLPIAGAREAMRLQLADAVDRAKDSPPAEDHVYPTIAFPPDEAADEFALAWEIAVRFQDFIRKGACQGCKDDVSGMHCAYRSFEEFGELRNFDGEECRRWAKLCRQIFGLINAPNSQPVQG